MNIDLSGEHDYYYFLFAKRAEVSNFRTKHHLPGNCVLIKITDNETAGGFDAVMYTWNASTIRCNEYFYFVAFLLSVSLGVQECEVS